MENFQLCEHESETQRSIYGNFLLWEHFHKAVTEAHYNGEPSLSREHHQVSVKSFLVMIASFLSAVSPFCVAEATRF